MLASFSTILAYLVAANVASFNTISGVDIFLRFLAHLMSLRQIIKRPLLA